MLAAPPGGLSANEARIIASRLLSTHSILGRDTTMLNLNLLHVVGYKVPLAASGFLLKDYCHPASEALQVVMPRRTRILDCQGY